MLDYPIYKHLIQFSSLIDKNGNLLNDPNAALQSKPPGSEEAKGDGDRVGVDEEDEQKEGGAYEGGDTQNT